LAKEGRGRLIIVHVQEAPMAYGGGEMYYGIPEPTTDELINMLRDVKPTDESVPIEYRLVSGDPTVRLRRYPKSRSCRNLIV